MFKGFLKYLILPVILLHFAGVTQLVSSLVKDQGSFVNMLSMTEEENKKEKDEKDDNECKLTDHKHSIEVANHAFHTSNFGFVLAAEEISHQFIGESTTPPPDSNA
ncbi:MAG: hypothetical protein U0V74_03945 [Chitinophagales bacterium]